MRAESRIQPPRGGDRQVPRECGACDHKSNPVRDGRSLIAEDEIKRVADLLCALSKGTTGLRWSRTIGTAGAWYLPRSRDRDPHTDCINGVAGALRQAGFTAEIAIDTTPRATAAVEADRAQRSATRAHRLTERSARLIHQGTDEWARARELASHLPLGQPDLVDHHSYPRTR
ncbi:MAG: hypothetical protein DLM60_11815 [Pseudonocardiales bacterium]|nr:MAG: hypothetical protein DLM60_11815 [Pseudonocardiales bacterium]